MKSVLSNIPIARPVLLLVLVVIVVAAVLPADAHEIAPAQGRALELSAVAVSVQEIDLDWTVAPELQPSIASFRISRDRQVLTTVDAATFTYADMALTATRRVRYAIEALDAAGKRLAAAQSDTIRTPAQPETADKAAPTEPEDIYLTPVAGAILLDWYYAIDDSDISAFLIRRDGRRLALVRSGTLRYIDTKVRPGQTYAYTIEAIDIVGKHSRPSQPLAAAPLAGSLSPGARAQLLAGDPPAAALPNAATYNATLKRYPYLTDVVLSSATINWATDRSASTGSIKWGAVDAGGACTPSTTVAATKTNLTVNTVLEYQWKATLTLAPNTQYCYRVYLATTDLLGSDSSPRFWTQIPAGSSQPYSFAVFGDWGAVETTGANTDQANLIQQIASSGARFAITTGDNSYPSGSQNNYGDLVETGADLSGIFGPSFWKVAGASMPLFLAMGNHGLARSDSVHPHLLNWPQSVAVSSSGGRYVKDTYCCLNGTSSASYPSTWYAFDAGNARFYVLHVAWADSNVGTATAYKNDYDYHLAPGTPQYQWLVNDLATHPGGLKFAFLHYPIYSDKSTNSPDTFLQGANKLEGLLSSNGVNIAFSGHAHIYQRNIKPNANSLISYVTGAGGAKLEPIGPNGCSPVDAYGLGWSYSANGGAGAGSACGAAPVPSSRAKVFHFLLVTVNGNQVTVAPTNSLGQTFDVQTYTFGGAIPTSTPTSPPAPTNTPTSPPAPTNTPTSPPAPTNTPTSPPAPTNTPVAGYVFSDGFESGTFSAWTSSGGLVAQSTVVHTGSFAAQGTTTNGGTYAKKTLATTYGDGYLRIYYNLLSASSQVNLLRLRTAADSSIAYLYIDTAGRLNLRNDAGAATVTSTVVPGAGWHALELHAVISGATSATEVWLDGVKIGALSVSTNLGTTPIGRLQVGEVQAGRTYNVLFDDSVFNTQPIGP